MTERTVELAAHANSSPPLHSLLRRSPLSSHRSDWLAATEGPTPMSHWLSVSKWGDRPWPVWAATARNGCQLDAACLGCSSALLHAISVHHERHGQAMTQSILCRHCIGRCGHGLAGLGGCEGKGAGRRCRAQRLTPARGHPLRSEGGWNEVYHNTSCRPRRCLPCPAGVRSILGGSGSQSFAVEPGKPRGRGNATQSTVL